tara:strand:- start:2196 stop:3032 length:837 start_codon:yes stop_codon:yes gene_type:complete
MNYNQNQIIEFIDSEKLDKQELDIYKAYIKFCKCYIKALINLHSKFDKTQCAELTYIISGSNIMNYIYWHILSYTNNVRLTLFLSERAILLFTEFLLLTKNPKINRQFLFLPNLNDAISFVFERTIGDLMNNSNYSEDMIYVRNAGQTIKHMLEYCFIETYEAKKTYEHYFDFILNYITNITLLLYEKIDNIDENINHIIHKIYITQIDIDTKLYIIKNTIESFLKLYDYDIEIPKIIEIIDIVINDTIIYIKNKENINKNCITNYFKNHIKKLINFK